MTDRTDLAAGMEVILLVLLTRRSALALAWFSVFQLEGHLGPVGRSVQLIKVQIPVKLYLGSHSQSKNGRIERDFLAIEGFLINFCLVANLIVYYHFAEDSLGTVC